MQTRLTTSIAEMDPEWIWQNLLTTAWAKGRSLEQVKSYMEHSLNFAVIVNGRQVAYARVVTDYTIFAYIMDVFVEERERGKGYARMLMQGIMEHPRLSQVGTFRLATTNSHPLYAKFGFVPLANPANFMELIRKK